MNYKSVISFSFVLLASNVSASTPSAGDYSIFTYQNSEKPSHYAFAIGKTNDAGIKSNTYYNLVLKQDNIGSSDNITYYISETQPDDLTNVVTLILPDKTLYLTYTPNTTITSVDNNVIGDAFGQINTLSSDGGVIYNESSLGNITGDFVANTTKNKPSSHGGAVSNQKDASIGNITGDFIGNYISVKDKSNNARGGAIYNNGSIDSITGDFLNNGVSSKYRYAFGGALTIDADGKITNNVSGNFVGNYAISSDSYHALGGAIFTQKKLNFSSGKDTKVITANYTLDTIKGKQYNAIYIVASSYPPTVTFDTTGGGAWIINDSISGGNSETKAVPLNYADYQYNLSFIGDDILDAKTGTTKQHIDINNSIINVGKVKVENTTLRFGAYQHEDKTAKNWDGKGKFVALLDEKGVENLTAPSVTSLSLKNAAFDIANGYMETINLKTYSANNSFVHLDVDPENMTSDVINVNGDIEGTTKLIIHAKSDKELGEQDKILFAQSTKDTKGNEKSFEIARIYNSPYLYSIIYDSVENTSATTEANDNTWSFGKGILLTAGTTSVAPEIIATSGVTISGLSQTNGMINNIMHNVNVNQLYCPGCGFYDYNWDGKSLHNAWADTTYNGLKISAPVDIEANVWGLDAGADIQQNLNNKLGVFASYRKGNYEMSGDGEKIYSTIGSEVDIDSYLAGLYYRFDKNNWYAFATVYGGLQKAEIKTDDGVKSDTDGTEFGASAEMGYQYALNRNWSLTPSLAAFYSQIDYDDATDNAGKTVKYNNLKQVELEAGLKLAHSKYTLNGFYAFHIKPSIVQTLVDGDEINVEKLGKVETVEDKTLGRIEVGGTYGFAERWSAYGWSNYTFGSDYDAVSLGLGLNYAW